MAQLNFDDPQPLAAGANKRPIAWRALRAGPNAQKPGIVWLGGFKSDMTGSKALALEAFARKDDRGFVRFDYSGHGESGGDFKLGTISRWLEDSLAVIQDLTTGPQILVGSSMGGWLALLCARALAGRGESEKIAGMVLIAPAVDFTEDLLRPCLPPQALEALSRDKIWLAPSPYSPEPTPFTQNLFDDARSHLLFGQTIRSYGPVHILQGMADPDVPWRHALKLVEHMPEDPVILTFIRDGDHRLSRDEDLARLIQAVDHLV